jgi:transcriptional regulator with XRE-family HTH domain
MAPSEKRERVPAQAEDDANRSSQMEASRQLLASRLRTARTMAGLSQGQVARLLGLHRPSISEAEAGRRRVSADELAQFSKHYGVSPSWLMGTSPEAIEATDARVELAARELGKLQPEDLDRVLQLLAALRSPGNAAG